MSFELTHEESHCMFYSPQTGIWGYLTFKHLKVFIECIVHLTF